jgi:dTDP-4-dehydrorhamnose reductase
VQEANPHAIIARVNFYGWSLYGQRSLAEFFFTNLSAGREVNGFTDVYFCPLLVNDLGQLLLEMAGRRLTGLYHVASRECVSKYEFGVQVARQFGFDPSLVKPCSVNEGNLVARRALNLSLDTSKLTRALGVPLPGLEVGLQKFYQQFLEGYPQALALLRG